MGSFILSASHKTWHRVSNMQPKVAVIGITFPEREYVQQESAMGNLHRQREMLSAGLAALPESCSLSKRTHESKTWFLGWKNQETHFQPGTLSPSHKVWFCFWNEIYSQNEIITRLCWSVLSLLVWFPYQTVGAQRAGVMPVFFIFLFLARV